MGINIIERLRAQHGTDLKLYRSAHCEWKNRILHWLLIPVECFCASLCLWILTGCFYNAFDNFCHPIIWWFIPRAITGFLGLLSVLIATNTTIGMVSFLYHIFLIKICDSLTTQIDNHSYHPNEYLWVLVMIAAGLWTFAWTIQVYLGHVLFERNLPNIANPAQVSYLAMSQSVLIAWSS
jgi:hypothetical protein